ncbi:saccharopine dehydrogenase [Nocardioides sp. Root1257]|uniref:saccharopine dehydrogenase n=1 Tax=unclassified Nocardioides TaxID=2615069 RepID=UPI0006F6E493|nr:MULTISPECIES: saccharopine dehydrogenase [unclassified Nocardioides]KQW53156.1 saccharopine dehydrogenase [Nocardioides sp. Root1257]KRC55843.1 saccharopine dehydrogenase [Nocardioides sp. Root224]
MQPVHLWIRSETRGTERRAPVVPADVPLLLDGGFEVTVEESRQRIFPIDEYAAAGALVADEGSWTTAPHDAYVLGIKELPEEPDSLGHRHIYFAHAFKGQDDARETLERFRRGGGRLFDIEYLVDENNRRVVAFGHWAGYVGAALGVLHLAGTLTPPLAPMAKHELDEELKRAGKAGVDQLLALVTGARGRSGRGAQQALLTAGLATTRWDRKETQDLHKQALLGHDMLVNCVVTHTPTTPFVEQADLEHERRLRVLADVTCDVTGPTNMLPVNTEITTWEEPVRRLHDGAPGEGSAPLDVIAIDNLPSLLPREASEGFSADLTPHLLGLAEEGGPTAPWGAAGQAFDQAIEELEAPAGS